MKVIIKNVLYDPNETPIIIHLNEDEKLQIGEMPEGTNNYCQYPENMEKEAIKALMEKAKKRFKVVYNVN